jgi:hypothetical protein
VRGALRRGNQGDALQLRLGVFKVRTRAAGQSKEARFGGSVVGLR